MIRRTRSGTFSHSNSLHKSSSSSDYPRNTRLKVHDEAETTKSLFSTDECTYILCPDFPGEKIVATDCQKQGRDIVGHARVRPRVEERARDPRIKTGSPRYPPTLRSQRAARCGLWRCRRHLSRVTARGSAARRLPPGFVSHTASGFQPQGWRPGWRVRWRTSG